MSYSNSITEAQVLTAVGNWLQTILPAGTAIQQGQQNSVPQPLPPSVIMTPVSRFRLSTNIDTWVNTPLVDTLQIETDTRYDLQLDFYSLDSQASENAQVVMALWRDAFAYATLAPLGIAPLYTSEPANLSYVNDQKQYEHRWTLTAYGEINPVISVPQQFADTLVGGVFNVDATFPPNG